MSEMIDRVAVALREGWLDGRFSLECAGREDWSEIARVAVEAMRIPRTPGFVQDITDMVFNEKIDGALK